MSLVLNATPAGAGPKAKGLDALSALGFAVPPWVFVCAPTGSEAETALVFPINELPVLRDALRAIDTGSGRFAVRSCFADEDGARFSHAGLFRSYLDVPLEEVPARITEVWSSLRDPSVKAYRAALHLPMQTHLPDAIVQAMVPAEMSGVAFLGSPPGMELSTSNDDVNIAISHGLGNGVAEGTAEVMLLRVDSDGKIFNAGLGSSIEIAHENAAAIASAVRLISAALGSPQDVEWALVGNRLHLLQTRPITPTANKHDLTNWSLLVDCNTAPLYPGIVSPLSFSVAKAMQRAIMLYSAKVAWAPGQSLDDIEPLLDRMLVRYKGRVVFDQLRWFELQARLGCWNESRIDLLTRLKTDGVPGRVAEELVAISERSHQIKRSLKIWRIANKIKLYLTVLWIVPAFIRRVRCVLAEAALHLDQCDAKELIERYRLIESQLLCRWDGIVINDYLAMRLQSALEFLIGSAAIVNCELSMLTGVAASDQAITLEKLSALARSRSLGQVLANGDPDLIRQTLESDDVFKAAWQEYLECFGSIAWEELKLESLTTAEDPLPWLRGIGQGACAGDVARIPQPSAEREVTQIDLHNLTFWRRICARTLLWLARRRFRTRENLRLHRSQVYGALRCIFRQLGKRLYESGKLSDPSDVFLFDLYELDAMLSQPHFDTRGFTLLRSRELAAHRAMGDNSPMSMLLHAGVVVPTNCSVDKGAAASDGLIVGIGCAPGRAIGLPNMDMRQAEAMGPVSSLILVSPHPYPVLAALLPRVVGVLTETGSPFCHLAIVARELGIPMVAGVRDIMLMANGSDIIEIDGDSGSVWFRKSTASVMAATC